MSSKFFKFYDQHFDLELLKMMGHYNLLFQNAEIMYVKEKKERKVLFYIEDG